MSLIERILNLNDMYENKDKKYTVVKFDVRNACCTSQADGEFIMTIKQLSFTDYIYYLFEECKPHLEVLFDDEDDEDDKEELFSIIYKGLKSIMESKRLSIYDCECGLEFFIFNEGDEIIVDKSDFYSDGFNDKYNINMHFEF
jgi:hypothetical protein